MYVQGPIVIGGKLCWANQSVHLSVIIQYNSCAQSMLFFSFLLVIQLALMALAPKEPQVTVQTGGSWLRDEVKKKWTNRS